MKTAFTITTAVALMLGLVAPALAQTDVASGGSNGYGAVGYYPVYGYGGYGYHSSTYEEGVLRGLGALARARGEAHYWNSLAAINRQEAYARYVKNRELATQTYFQMKQINRAAREANKLQPLSQEQYAELARKQAPDRLTEVQYDRTFGRLEWPAMLQGPEFAAEREMLTRAFEVRSPSDVGPGSAFYSKVREGTESMRGELLAKIDQASPAEFMAAKKFLDGLTYEAQQPLVVRTLASAK